MNWAEQRMGQLRRKSLQRARLTYKMLDKRTGERRRIWIRDALRSCRT